MRALAVHADVIVFISRVWQTTSTAVRSGDEGVLIDSPVYPDELEALPAVTEQAGFPVSGLIATHGDWDHLLGRLAFPDTALGCAESTATRLADAPGEVQRELRRFDQDHYVERARPLALGAAQSLPVPGHLSLGSEHELDLLPADGHTSDGMAVWVPWANVLVCGDYLSPVEIPVISKGGSASAYLSTLERLAASVERAERVIPGHGSPLDSGRALRILEEDRAYLEALQERGSEAAVPASRSSRAQRAIHAENARTIDAGGPVTRRRS